MKQIKTRNIIVSDLAQAIYEFILKNNMWSQEMLSDDEEYIVEGIEKLILDYMRKY